MPTTKIKKPSSVSEEELGLEQSEGEEGEKSSTHFLVLGVLAGLFTEGFLALPLLGVFGSGWTVESKNKE